MMRRLLSQQHWTDWISMINDDDMFTSVVRWPSSVRGDGGGNINYCVHAENVCCSLRPHTSQDQQHACKVREKKYEPFPCRDIVHARPCVDPATFDQHCWDCLKCVPCLMSCMIGELSCGDLNTRTVSCTCVHWCVTCTCVHVCPVHYQDTLYNTTVTQYPRTRDHHSVIPISTISPLTLLDTHSSIIQVISLYIYIYIFIFKWGWRKTNIHEDFYDLNCRLREFQMSVVIYLSSVSTMSSLSRSFF